jgi:hypothetical protein
MLQAKEIHPCPRSPAYHPRLRHPPLCPHPSISSWRRSARTPPACPLWLSIFLVPIAVLNAGLPTTAAGAVAVVWIVCALVLLARLPHD